MRKNIVQQKNVAANKKKAIKDAAGSIRELDYEVGKNKPPKANQFSSTNQPNPKHSAESKARNKFTKDVLRQMLEMPYKFTEDSQIKQQLSRAFGEEILNKSVMEIMVFQQMQKAILKADSVAFSNLLDRIMGRPVQAVAQTDTEGNDVRPIFLRLPKGMNIELPSNIEGTGDEE